MNVSIENGELVIDSIDIGVLNRAEEVFKKSFEHEAYSSARTPSPAPDSLEIELIEDDSVLNSSTQATTQTTTEEVKPSSFQTTTIHFDVPTISLKHDHSKQIELTGSSGDGLSGEGEDGIKIKTTDKDSDTIFYMSNAEVKVIESIPTASPMSAAQTKKSDSKKKSSNKKFQQPATMFEEDVIVDVPAPTDARKQQQMAEKFEEDIILSPLTSPFDPKDINYIGEAFLDVEESQNGMMSSSENRHIIPLTSDVVIQPASLRESQSFNGIPIIGEIPPQIELEEMVFNDDYDNKQMSNLRLEEIFLNSRLLKNSLEADVPKEQILDVKNFTIFAPNRTHITVNTIINGTNATTISTASSLATNGTLRLEAEEMDMGVAGEWTQSSAWVDFTILSLLRVVLF